MVFVCVLGYLPVIIALAYNPHINYQKASTIRNPSTALKKNHRFWSKSRSFSNFHVQPASVLIVINVHRKKTGKPSSSLFERFCCLSLALDLMKLGEAQAPQIIQYRLMTGIIAFQPNSLLRLLGLADDAGLATRSDSLAGFVVGCWGGFGAAVDAGTCWGVFSAAGSTVSQVLALLDGVVVDDFAFSLSWHCDGV